MNYINFFAAVYLGGLFSAKPRHTPRNDIRLLVIINAQLTPLEYTVFLAISRKFISMAKIFAHPATALFPE